MIPVQCPFPPGMVGIISGDLARFPQFETSTYGMLVPRGSGWARMQGQNICANRNLIIREMRPEHQWVWFIDDDQPFHPETLMRLLHRNVDIIQPMVSTRKPPYVPHAQRVVDGVAHVIPWDELVGDVMEVDAVGAGGVLIRRHVLDAMQDPWFRAGRTGPEHLGEDLSFCMDAKKLGFKCWVDLETITGHMNTHSVTPVRVDGKWRIEVDLGHGVVARLPADNGAHAATIG